MSSMNRSRTIRRVRVNESDQDFMSRKKLEANKFWTQAFIALIMITAAATTFSFGLIGSWGDVDFSTLPPQVYWRTIWRGVAAAFVVTLLLDGARLGWSWARVAAKTTPWMQYLAIGMEVAAFGASVLVSMMGLPPLLTFLGLELTFDADLLNVVLTLVLQYSLAANLIAVFVYLVLSPESLRLMKVASIESQRQQVYLMKFGKILDSVIKGEGTQIENFLTPIAEDWIQDGANAFLGQQGYAQLPSPPAGRRAAGEGPPIDLVQMADTMRELGDIDRPPVLNGHHGAGSGNGHGG